MPYKYILFVIFMPLSIFRSSKSSHLKGRGRPTTDPVNRFRIVAWYLFVKSKGNWSDYKLDVTFGLPNALDARENAARPRMFELIRKRGVIPERGLGARRGFDLIELVNQHPNFIGSKAIYDSPFWQLISDTSPTLKSANNLVNRLLKIYGLARIEREYDSLIYYSFKNNEIPPQHREYFQMNSAWRFHHHFTIALKNLPSDLDRLTLTGALFREAYLGMSLEEAEYFKNILQNQNDILFRDLWLRPLRESLKPLVIKRLIYWSIDPDEKLGGWTDSIDVMLKSYIFPGRFRQFRKQHAWRKFCNSVRAGY